MTNNYYYTSSIKLQNYLEDNGVYPVIEKGQTAGYIETDNLFSLLDRYTLLNDIFKGAINR